MIDITATPGPDAATTPRRYAQAVFFIMLGVAFAPYLTWRPFDVLFTFSDFCLSIGFVLLLAAGRLPLSPLHGLSGLWLLSLGLLLAGLLAGSLINGDPDRWIIVALQYCFAILVIPMLLVRHTQQVLDRLALALVIGVTAMETFGIGVYYLFKGGYWDLYVFGANFITGTRRLGAFLSDGNWNGCVIAMTLPFVIHLIVRRRIPALAGYAILAILVLALVLAASVTALASAVVGVLVYAFVAGAWPSPRAVLAAFAVITLYFAAGGGIPQAFGLRVAPALQNENIAQAGSWVGRVGLMEEAWGLVEHTTILGLGVDQYRHVSIQGAPVHNMYLLVWAEGGIWSLIGWLGIITLLTIASASALVTDRRAAGLALALVTILVLASTASPHMYARMWVTPVFLAIGFALAARRPATVFPPSNQGNTQVPA